jgi:stage II sporulation protein D
MLVLHATGSSIQIDSDKSATAKLRMSGAYQLNATGDSPLRADFPIEIRANYGHLLLTAFMPMEEHVAGALAGETGNFKSDEALRAMAVAARTFAMHFGSHHALDGFDFCDTTHCQDLRIAGIDAHLRSIASSTAGEILWYDGETASEERLRSAYAEAQFRVTQLAQQHGKQALLNWVQNGLPTEMAPGAFAHNGR